MWHFHTTEYGTISMSSHYRYLPTFASMILAKYSTMINYCISLILYQLDGGAVYLCHIFHELCKDSFLTGNESPRFMQTMLPLAKSKNANAETQKPLPLDYTEPPSGCLTWADGLYNLTYTPCEFSIVVEMAEYQQDAKLGAQEQSIQKIMDMIAMVSCAWADNMGALEAWDKPALHADLIPCLEEIINMHHVHIIFLIPTECNLQILSNNAYMQCMYPQANIDLMNAWLQDEKLCINIPGVKGSKSRSVQSIENNTFVVYTQEEVEEWLVDLEVEYYEGLDDVSKEEEEESPGNKNQDVAYSKNTLVYSVHHSLLMLDITLQANPKLVVVGMAQNYQWKCITPFQCNVMLLLLPLSLLSYTHQTPMVSPNIFSPWHAQSALSETFTTHIQNLHARLLVYHFILKTLVTALTPLLQLNSMIMMGLLSLPICLKQPAHLSSVMPPSPSLLSMKLEWRPVSHFISQCFLANFSSWRIYCEMPSLQETSGASSWTIEQGRPFKCSSCNPCKASPQIW